MARRRSRRPRNTLDPQPFMALPRAFEPLIQVGAERMLRWLWIHACAMALISSTTPSGRWLILHHGFLTFQRQAGAGALFDVHTNYRLDTNELRAVFHGIAEYVARREAHMHQHFEALYQKELRTTRTTHLFEDAKPITIRPQDINVEAVRDGFLQRVS